MKSMRNRAMATNLLRIWVDDVVDDLNGVADPYWIRNDPA